MKKLPLLVLLGAGLSCNSQAQSFGDFLKNAAADAARHAVAGNVRQAVTNAVDSAAKGVTQPSAAAGAPSAEQAAPSAAAAKPVAAPGCGRMKGTPLAIGARPEGYQPESLWPENTCPVYSESDLKFERATAAKHVFREASKVPCGDCEGGNWPDAWAWRSLVKNSRDYSADYAKLLVALKEGETLKWKGNRFDVVVTAIGAHPIGAMPCRQFHYVLTEKGKRVAEHDSLWCEYTGAYASKSSWHEMV